MRLCILHVGLCAALLAPACNKKKDESNAKGDPVVEAPVDDEKLTGAAEAEDGVAPEGAAARVNVAELPAEWTGSAYDAPMVKAMHLGETFDEGSFSVAIPNLDLTRTEEMAEGELAGYVWRGEGYFALHQSKDFRNTAVDLLRRTNGIIAEPGVSTYNSLKETLGLTRCLSGIDDSAESIFCETNAPGMILVFANTTDDVDKQLSPDVAEKVLGNAKLKFVRIKEPQKK